MLQIKKIVFDQLELIREEERQCAQSIMKTINIGEEQNEPITESWGTPEMSFAWTPNPLNLWLEG